MPLSPVRDRVVDHREDRRRPWLTVEPDAARLSGDVDLAARGSDCITMRRRASSRRARTGERDPL